MEDEALLGKDQILAAEDIGVKTVEVKEWGGKVRLVGMTGAERDAFTASIAEGKGRDKDFSLVNIRAKFISKHLKDDGGKPLLTPAELGTKSSKVIEQLYNICAELSGMSEEHMRELAKNSPAGPSEDSPSDSPAG